MRITADGLLHNGNGDFSDSQFYLNTETTISSLNFALAGIDYLRNVHTTFRAGLEVDNLTNSYLLKDNELRLNDLALLFDGSVQMQEDCLLDLRFKVAQTEFKHLLSLLPAVYAHGYEGIEATGKLTLDGFIKGRYGENDFPAFAMNARVDDGTFRYPELPKSVNDINLNLRSAVMAARRTRRSLRCLP
jgi:hypothetical protein